MSNKIYLGKSNRANPDHVMLVREALSKFDVEIVEFKGGTYSHKPLLECDKLIIIPDLNDISDYDTIPLGRGLHEQVEAFNEHAYGVPLVVVEVSKHYCTLRAIDDLDFVEDGDYINYSQAILEGEGLSLHDMFYNHYGFSKNSPKKIENSTKKSTKKGSKYILIGKK